MRRVLVSGFMYETLFDSITYYDKQTIAQSVISQRFLFASMKNLCRDGRGTCNYNLAVFSTTSVFYEHTPPTMHELTTYEHLNRLIICTAKNLGNVWHNMAS